MYLVINVTNVYDLSEEEEKNLLILGINQKEMRTNGKTYLFSLRKTQSIYQFSLNYSGTIKFSHLISQMLDKLKFTNKIKLTN